ncbi:uncharacterized protein LOC144448818 [Glandiceps talaboti]
MSKMGICFDEVDPSFPVILDAIRELRCDDRLDVVAVRRAANDYICGDDPALYTEYEDQTDFINVMPKVLEMFMLKVTGMSNYNNPKFGEHVMYRNLSSDVNFSISGYGPTIMMASSEYEAKEFTSNFARLYPYHYIERKLEDLAVDGTMFLPRMMYVVEGNAPDLTFYEIVTTLSVTRVNPEVKKFKFVCKGSVMCTEARIREAEKASKDGFPNFMSLINLLHRCKEIKYEKKGCCSEDTAWLSRHGSITSDLAFQSLAKLNLTDHKGDNIPFVSIWASQVKSQTMQTISRYSEKECKVDAKSGKTKDDPSKVSTKEVSKILATSEIHYRGKRP